MLKKSLIVFIVMVINLYASDILVQDAYVRAVPPNVTNSASFMKITNNANKTIYLRSVDSNIAKDVELHEHTMSNGMMKMQQVTEILIPAHSSIELKPGGYHVMLIGLNKKIKAKDTVDFITLNFSDKTSITLKNIPVKSVMSGMKKMKH